MMTQFFQVLKQLKELIVEMSCFMMTQFFQVLKLPGYTYAKLLQFYDDSILPGTKTYPQ